MLLLLALTVVQAVQPVPGVGVAPERTWITRVVPVGALTSRVRVSHPTTAPPSMTAEVWVLELLYGATRTQSATSVDASCSGSTSMTRRLTLGEKAPVPT